MAATALTYDFQSIVPALNSDLEGRRMTAIFNALAFGYILRLQHRHPSPMNNRFRNINAVLLATKANFRGIRLLTSLEELLLQR
jgi:hypothetical protein